MSPRTDLVLARIPARFSCLLLAALAAGGCGRTVPQFSVTTPVATVAPKCAELPRGAASTVVRRLWCDVAEGRMAAATDRYDPEVQNLVGRANVAGALGLLKRSGIYGAAELTDVQRPSGLTVIRGQATGAASRSLTYVVRPYKSGWRITFDSVLQSALAGYVAAAKQRQIDRSTKSLSKEATAAANELVSRYTTQFPPPPG